ncbi:MAG: magnesium protoporphyrin IX methyltransferase [Rubrivivax sp.]|nr:magnesium protoporphyrin IX methyltransferase [Rubrivivax sp.]
MHTATTGTASSYLQRRERIETYFDRTAAGAWEQLTSTAPVGRVRATVRAGRDRMRTLLLSWLPADLCGARILDAGCGTGAFAMEAARRGAEVVAIDLSPALVDVARRRAAEQREAACSRIDFRSGDMTDPALGGFDHVVAMDSLIHYERADALRVLDGWAQRTRGSLLFTFAPSSPLLRTMHLAGKLFPRGDRSPAIVPLAEGGLRRALHDALPAWQATRCERVASGFYTSQALQLQRG